MGTDLVSELLDGLYRVFSGNTCPGGWIAATVAAGAVFALIPACGALLIAVIRKWTGNRYTTPVVITFVVIGVLGAFVLPLAAFNLTDSVLSGLSGPTPGGFGERYCLVGSPDDFFVGKPDIGSVLREGPGLNTTGVLTSIAVVCAVLAWPVTAWQARTALRRGPGWPTRLFWLPFAALLLGGVRVSAPVAGLLWAGYLPGALAGVALVALAGPPSWRAVNARPRQPPPHDPRPPAHPPAHQVPPHQPSPNQAPPPGAHQASAPQGMVPPAPGHQVRGYPTPPPAAVPPLPPTVVKPPHRPTSVMPSLTAPAAGEAPRTTEGLADTPGPLPFSVNKPDPVAAPNWIIDGDRFEPVRKLGAGGFGQVWLARDTRLDRHVAVKVAHAPDDETERRMHREARALAAVRHPNCVRVYDIVSGSGGMAIVMEYIEGDTLADTVRANGLLDDVTAARLWSTMAGALGAAHARNVLHRDVKPTNILVDPKGLAHLIDFGIARTKGDHTLTRAGLMVGTPDFLAQEVAAGGSATPASDSWQLAATVSYALTGKSPRGKRAEPGQALLAAAEGRACVNIPRESAHYPLLSAALANDPVRRPSLQVVARELDAWLAREGSSVDGPVTVRVPRQKFVDTPEVT